MGTNCDPLVADLFMSCYERDCMLFLSDITQNLASGLSKPNIGNTILEFYNNTILIWCIIACARQVAMFKY